MANTIRDYSATPANNTVVDGADISEGCSPAGINDAIRGVMSDLKDVSTGAVALESPAMDSLTVDTTGIVYSGGSVGIGTSSPQNLVQIEGSSGTVPSQLRLGVTTSGQYYDIGRDYTDGYMIFYSGQASPYTGYKWSINAGSEAMRIDSSGNVGISNTAPSNYYSQADNLVVGSTGDTGITIASGTANQGSLMFSDGTSGSDLFRGQIRYNHVSNYMMFATDAAERMRIDGANGNVGIGTSNPSTPLDAFKNAGGNQTVATIGAHNYGDGGATYVQIGTEYGDGSSRIGSINTGGNGSALVFEPHTAASGVWSEAMRIDSSGRVTMPYQPAFTASGGGSPSQGAGVLQYSSTSQDGFNLNVGGHYNTSNYRFTAPVSGNYFFCFNSYTDSSNGFDAAFRINGSTKGPQIQDLSTRTGSNTYVSLSASIIMPLNANDYVDVATTYRAYVDGNCFFSGYLMS